MKTLLAIAILLTNLISPTEFVDTSSYPKYDEVWNCGQEYLGIKHNDEIFYLNQQLEVCFSEDEYDYTVYNFPHDFLEGVVALEKDGKIGFVDKNNNVVIDFKYDGTNGFKWGQAIVCKDGKYGIIDKNDNVIFPFEYDYISYSNREGYYIIEKEDKYGYAYKDGSILISPIYDSLEYGHYLYYAQTDTYLVASLNDKYGVVDFNNNILIPFEHDEITVCNDKYMCVTKKTPESFGTYSDTYALFDINGNEIFPFDKYPYVGYKNGVIEKGNVFDNIRDMNYFNKNGEPIKKPQDSIILPAVINSEYLILKELENNKLSIITKDGKILEKHKFDEIENFYSDSFKVKISDFLGVWTKEKTLYPKVKLTKIIRYDSKGNLIGYNENEEKIYLIDSKGRAFTSFKGEDMYNSGSYVIIYEKDGSRIVPESLIYGNV